MTKYVPDNWVVIKIYPEKSKPLYKVLGGWLGGYPYGDSWRMNSGIISVIETDNYFHFEGSSGSDYRVNKKSYELSINTSGVWSALKAHLGDKVDIMPEDTNWIKIDWNTND